ncbi:uncharacterized protein VTP21DRAFT_3514 [Calcarisporiella thermophila]|uniref:uncharacterized protein n=1 Tax=Calcarisporiella thermophila TaxID=911321 RepID=UPI0037443443
MKAILLVGGASRGTRFRPLSLDLPKPLFPPGGDAAAELGEDDEAAAHDPGQGGGGQGRDHHPQLHRAAAQGPEEQPGLRNRDVEPMRRLGLVAEEGGPEEEEEEGTLMKSQPETRNKHSV